VSSPCHTYRNTLNDLLSELCSKHSLGKVASVHAYACACEYDVRLHSLDARRLVSIVRGLSQPHAERGTKREQKTLDYFQDPSPKKGSGGIA
jgi:hypothetical protein